MLHQELQRLKETRKALKAELREQSKEHRNLTARRKRLLQAGLSQHFSSFGTLGIVSTKPGDEELKQRRPPAVATRARRCVGDPFWLEC